jgi:hypothetical protein
MSCTSGLKWERTNEHHRRWDNRNRGASVDYRTGECDFMSGDHNQHQKPMPEKRVAISDNQQHEWVEITRGEIEDAFAMADNLTDFGFLVEAKCKAKNGYT